ncbi:MAG: hydrogen peroxide-inducible genes activator [Bacteroidia bacterium]|nr:hydrogen peroxide-inducible genes activator [Bacteroidia bacterium]
MTLQQLEYALALQKYGSYSRTATAMGITQPGISLQIKRLEDSLGLVLFDRTTRMVKPTEAGQLFLDKAQLLLAQARQLRELGKDLGEEYSGKFNIGIIPTLAPYLLPLFVQQLNESFPKLHITVREVVTEEIIEGIKTGELDFGIISTPIESKIKFQVLPLFYEKFLLFVSSKHELFETESIDIATVPPGDIWLLKEGNCLRNQVDDICNLNTRKRSPSTLFYFESNSIESLCRIVEHKGGVTILPELTTISFDSERESMIKELEGPERVREVSLIHLPNHLRSPFIAQIGEVIKGSVPRKLLEKGERDLVHTNVVV